jgi:hypothetical protein
MELRQVKWSEGGFAESPLCWFAACASSVPLCIESPTLCVPGASARHAKWSKPSGSICPSIAERMTRATL